MHLKVLCNLIEVRSMIVTRKKIEKYLILENMEMMTVIVKMQVI